MSAFNINNTISKFRLDKSKLASELFPNNKFPVLALNRIINGEAFLDTHQLDILSKITCTPVHVLFNDDKWNLEANTNQEKIVFYKNDYRVELMLESNLSSIYLKDKLIAEETLILDKNIKLSEYLALINKTIINLI